MRKIRTRTGAASFYVVAFSTLILLIIVSSFTALVVSQITRTTNDDLAQSAYDSALAGVEDAKLAYYNYRSCLAKGEVEATAPRWDNRPLTCGEIVYIMENAGNPGMIFDECDVVGLVLNRVNYTLVDGRVVGEEVVIKESSGASSDVGAMQQAYTCVKIQTSLKDYRSTLSSNNQMKVVKVELDGVEAKEIKWVKLEWAIAKTRTSFNFKNQNGFTNEADNPPTLSFALVQTATEYSMKDFEMSSGSNTDSGMVYLVPNRGSGGINNIPASVLSDSNNKSRQNSPQKVNCSDKVDGDYACQVMIALPEPVSNVSSDPEKSKRSNDTFMVAVALPYGGPATDFALSFYCGEKETCAPTINDEIEKPDYSDLSHANLKGVQIAVDSTGRAGNLFRRVEARLEGADEMTLSLMGPLELFDNGGSWTDGNAGLVKDYSVMCEYNFEPANVEQGKECQPLGN